MNKIFIVRVESPTGNNNNSFKKVYDRQIPFDDSLTFPYSFSVLLCGFFYSILTVGVPS